MKKSFLFAGLTLLVASSGFAQTKIGAAGAPDGSAMLEVISGAANNKGLLPPRMTTAQRDAITSPATGLMIYNTTANEVQVNTGTAATPNWTAATTDNAGWSTTGNTGTDVATSFIGTTDSQALAFRTNNTEAMRVTAVGRVGIGTNTPLAKVQVVDTGNATVIVSSSSGNGKATFALGNGHHGITRNLSDVGGNAVDVALFTTSAGPSLPASIHLAVRAGIHDSLDLNQFALKSTGRVGIGTNEPIAKLQVVDTGNAAIVVTNSDGSAKTSIGLGNQNHGITRDLSDVGGHYNDVALFTTSGSSTTITPSDVHLGVKPTIYDTLDLNQFVLKGTTGRVGIGTNTPKVKLHVNGGILLGRDSNIAYANGTLLMWSTVRSGIGETEFVNYRGTGTGGFRFYSVDPGTTTGTAAYNTNDIAFITPTGTYTTLSDKRVKTNVNVINDGLEKVMAMRPVSYDFHTGRTFKDGVVTFTKNDEPVKSIGFLAQELAKVVPEAVVIPKDPNKELYHVSYATLIPVLTKAIQEQQAEIEVLKAENKELKAKEAVTAQLMERVGQLEKKMDINKQTAN